MSTMKKTVGVIFGSRTVEHDVSIITAQQVMQALAPQKFDVVPIYITRSGQWLTGDGLRDLKTFQLDNHLADMMGIKDTVISPDTRHKGLITPPLTGRFGKNQLQKLDVVFPVMHGTHGEDGTLQGLLELADLPYVGAGVMAAAVARDKIMLKAVLAQHGVPVLKQVAFSRHDWITTPDTILEKITSTLTYPVFIKPATLGSSIGVARADNADEARNFINVAANFDRRILVEEAVENAIEINCAVLGNYDVKASVLEQPISWQEFLTYEEKYMRSEGPAGMKGAERKIPAPISPELTQRIQQMAIDAFKCVDGRGTARVDFLVRGNTDDVYLNEINMIPGSLAFYLWQESGMSAASVVERLIELAFEAYAEKRQTVYDYKTNLLAHAAAKGLKGIKK